MSGRLALDDPAGIALFRARLAAANYTGEGVRQALGSEGTTLAREAEIPVHLRRLAEPTPHATIIKLFVLEVPVSAPDAELAFAPLSLARLRAIGLLARGDDDTLVRAAVRIVPHDDLMMVSDLGFHTGQPVRSDYVPGVQRPSLALAHLTVRRPAERALDMGTGCGIQAILLARHCGQVVATDVSPRALSFAAFNALVNGVRNVEFRQGSWFEPVAGERFDVVVSNPPYVISPESRYLFRDSGLAGDSVSELVVRELPGVLADGGFGTVMVSWIQRRDEDPVTPLRRWVEGSGCDAWLLRYATEQPLTTAARWNEGEAANPAAYGEVIDRWVEYYRRLGVDAIAYGSVILRRRSDAQNWVRDEPLPAGQILRPASDQILRVFAAHDHLAQARDDRALLDETFALVDSLRFGQAGRYKDGAAAPDRLTLNLDEGLAFQASIDRMTAELLPRLDGRPQLRDALAEVFAATGRPAREREEFLTSGLAVVRRLFELGFLVRR